MPWLHPLRTWVTDMCGMSSLLHGCWDLSSGPHDWESNTLKCWYISPALSAFFLFALGSHIAYVSLKLTVSLRMSLNSWLSCLHFLSVLSTGISCHAPLPFYLLISCLTSSYMKSLGETVVVVTSDLDVGWISRTSNSQSTLWLAAVILVSCTSCGGKPFT